MDPSDPVQVLNVQQRSRTEACPTPLANRRPFIGIRWRWLGCRLSLLSMLYFSEPWVLEERDPCPPWQIQRTGPPGDSSLQYIRLTRPRMACTGLGWRVTSWDGREKKFLPISHLSVSPWKANWLESNFCFPLGLTFLEYISTQDVWQTP